MLVDSGLPTCYWLETVWTAVYFQNLVSFRQNSDILPTKIWYGKKQSISHMYAFRATIYTHILLDQHSSKLGPHTTHLVLISYFSWRSYKLLDCETGVLYSKRKIHFNKRPTNFTKSTECTEWEDNNNLFPQKILNRRTNRVLE